MKRRILQVFIILLSAIAMHAQVTTSSMTGRVTDDKGEELIGATVVVIHVPSGTEYGTITNEEGTYFIQGMRVGGPYKISVSYIGYQDYFQEDIFTSLGVATKVNCSLKESNSVLDEIVVLGEKNAIFSSTRTGASSTFDAQTVANLPNIGSRSITNITKYNPNGNGSNFGGQDSRLNNFTIDGSVFNNAFGLGSATEAGARTGSTAISLDAIEQVQVNVAPFDVRQSGFVGAGLNAVTRSGSNEFSGSVFRNWRSADFLVGRTANDKNVAVGQFNEEVFGGRLGGAIIKNKVFFFVNAETVRKTEPGTSWVATGSTNPGQVSRVLKSDIEGLSSYMKDNFGLETGPYEAFNLENKSTKFMGRLDFNISKNHKLNVRYIHHDSEAEIPISTSSSLGFGGRRDNVNSMSFKNSGYLIQDNTRSIVLDLNSNFSNNLFNNLIVGFDKQIEDRGYLGPIFPTVDILEGGQPYISLGMDPFTPANRLNYTTLHITNNLTYYKNKHTITGGVHVNLFKSNNNFFPGSNGVYVYNSLDDFYAAANDALANPTSTTSPVAINRFQYRYSALPGGAEPLQVLEANKFDLYLQDAYQVNQNFLVTAGIRASMITMGNTALENTYVTEQTFIDEDGVKNYKINTGEMPGTQFLFEPRLGFNYNVNGKDKTQIRGGAGIFTGRPPYVWISNQIGNNGILTGFIDSRNTTAFPFRADATVFTPAEPTLPSTIEIAASTNDYKFPQIIKTNFAVDQKLPFNLIGSLEFIYNKNLNAAYYWNANLEPSTGKFEGVDQRDRFPGSGSANINNDIRIVDNISSAVVLGNTNQGSLTQFVAKMEYPSRNGWYGMLAYTYSSATDLLSAGSIAAGSWFGIRSVNGNNRPDLSFSDNDIPHRLIGILSWSEELFGDKGFLTGFSIGYVGSQQGRFSYVYAGDMNGDNVFNNDLIFVPQNAADLKFEEFTTGGVTFTVEDQIAAFDKYINQDEYLSSRRGQYAERNGGIRPFVHNFDLSFTQDLVFKISGKANRIQLRLDVINFGNMINNAWGVDNVVLTDRILTYRKVENNQPVYRFATQVDPATNKPILAKDTFTSRQSLGDVWQAQFGIRYTFN